MRALLLVAFLMVLHSSIQEQKLGCIPQSIQIHTPTTSQQNQFKISFKSQSRCNGQKISIISDNHRFELNLQNQQFDDKEDKYSYDVYAALIQNAEQAKCSGLNINIIKCQNTGKIAVKKGNYFGNGGLKNTPQVKVDHPYEKSHEVQSSSAGQIVIYVILIVAVLGLLFFIINWLRCMRRRQRYDEAENDEDDTIENKI